MPSIDDDIKTAIEENPVLIFIKGEKQMPMCGFSNQVIQMFKEIGGEFETRNVLQSPEYKQAVKDFSGWPTFPQVYIQGKLVGGCDIAVELFESGELKTMVEAASAA